MTKIGKINIENLCLWDYLKLCANHVNSSCIFCADGCSVFYRVLVERDYFRDLKVAFFNRHHVQDLRWHISFGSLYPRSGKLYLIVMDGVKTNKYEMPVTLKSHSSIRIGTRETIRVEKKEEGREIRWSRLYKKVQRACRYRQLHYLSILNIL